MQNYTKQLPEKVESFSLSEREELTPLKSKKARRIQNKQNNSLKRKETRKAKEERLWK